MAKYFGEKVFLEGGVITLGTEAKVAVFGAATAKATVTANRVATNITSSRIVQVFQAIGFCSSNDGDSGCVLAECSFGWRGEGYVHSRHDWRKSRDAGHGNWGGCGDQLGDMDFSFLGSLVVKVVDRHLHAEHLVMAFLGG